MSVYKVVGCLMGFNGIILMNLGTRNQMLKNISFMGDGMFGVTFFCIILGEAFHDGYLIAGIMVTRESYLQISPPIRKMIRYA